LLYSAITSDQSGWG